MVNSGWALARMLGMSMGDFVLPPLLLKDQGMINKNRKWQDRSRYMPHIGAKERARHAGKPDGLMHGLPPLFRKVL